MCECPFINSAIKEILYMLISVSHVLFTSNTSSGKAGGKFNLRYSWSSPTPLFSVPLVSEGMIIWLQWLLFRYLFCFDLHGPFKSSLLHLCHACDTEILGAELWVCIAPSQVLWPTFLRSLGPARELHVSSSLSINPTLFSQLQEFEGLHLPFLMSLFRLLETIVKALQQKPRAHLKRWKEKMEKEKTENTRRKCKLTSPKNFCPQF